MDFTPTYLDVGFDELVDAIDLAPTLLRVAGCEVPSTMQCCDLRERVQREVMFAASSRGTEYMVRSRTHKLLFCEDVSFDRLHTCQRSYNSVI